MTNNQGRRHVLDYEFATGLVSLRGGVGCMFESLPRVSRVGASLSSERESNPPVGLRVWVDEGGDGCLQSLRSHPLHHLATDQERAHTTKKTTGVPPVSHARCFSPRSQMSYYYELAQRTPGLVVPLMAADTARQKRVQELLCELGFQGHAWVSLIGLYLAPVIGLVGSNQETHKTSLLNSLLEWCAVSDPLYAASVANLASKPEQNPFLSLDGERVSWAQLQKRAPTWPAERSFVVTDPKRKNFVLPTHVATVVPTYIRWAPAYSLCITLVNNHKLIWQGGVEFWKDGLEEASDRACVLEFVQNEQNLAKPLGSGSFPHAITALAITIYGPFTLLREGAVLVDLPGTNHTEYGPESALGLPCPSYPHSYRGITEQFGSQLPQITQLWTMSNWASDEKVTDSWLRFHQEQESAALVIVEHLPGRLSSIGAAKLQQKWLQRRVSLSPACTVTPRADDWSSDADKRALLQWTFGLELPPPPSQEEADIADIADRGHKRSLATDSYASAPKRQRR